MEKQPIYIVTGIMASGKSTISELLACQFPRGVHLRGDMYRKMIVSGRVDMTANAGSEALRQLNIRYDLSANTAQSYSNAGFTVVWQDVIVGKVLPEVIARVRTCPLYLIVLSPDPKVIESREKTRSKTGYGGGFTPDNFHKLLITETPHIGLWIDSSMQTPEQTVSEILLRTSNGEGIIK